VCVRGILPCLPKNIKTVLMHLEAVREWLFSAISASGSDFNPQNTQCIPAVKIFAFLDLAKNFSFSDSLLVTGHLEMLLTMGSKTIDRISKRVQFI
jgi:hypothetical protein